MNVVNHLVRKGFDHITFTWLPWAPAGGGGKGALAPPLGILKNDVIYCRPTKYTKIFAPALGDRNTYTVI